MPTYGKNNFKESNVNYLNKDFTSLKNSLIREIFKSRDFQRIQNITKSA